MSRRLHCLHQLHRLRCTALPTVVVLVSVMGTVLAGLATTAQATALLDGAADAARRPVVLAAPTTGADAATLDLASGRIDAVAADGSGISLQGRLVPLHPSQLLVLAPGGQRYNSSRALRPGMRVRFALEPVQRSSSTAAAAKADTSRRIVLIYIESAP